MSAFVKGKFLFILLFSIGSLLQSQDLILHKGHSHNDYEHRRPLFYALENGFRSIEIDVFLHKDELIVSHIPLALNLKPDLRSRYFEPLRKIIQENEGTVFPNDSTTLIIYFDFKTGGGTWEKLRELMGEYEEMFMKWNGDSAIWGPIEVLVDGHEGEIQSENPRWSCVQKGLGDFAHPLPSNVLTRLNAPYGSQLKWRGIGKFPDDQRQKLEALVDSANAHGRTFRLYAGTNNPKVWKALLDAGVEWINADNLKKFNRFYREYLAEQD